MTQEADRVEEILDDNLSIVWTPIGYTVYSEDLEGEQVSPALADKRGAECFVAGYKAGLERALEALS